MDSLSQVERDTLDQFVVVTGLSLDDEAIATQVIALLAHHGFNLNNSVLAYFDTGLDLPEPSAVRDASYSQPQLDPFDTSHFHRNLQSDFASELFIPKLSKAPKIANSWQFDLGLHMSRRETEKENTEERKAALDGSPPAKPRRLSVLWIILLVVPRTLSFLYSAFRYFFGLNLTTNLYEHYLTHFDYESYDPGYTISQDISDIQELSSSYNLHYDQFNSCHDSSQRDYDFLLTILFDSKSAAFVASLLESEHFKSLFSKQAGEFKETQLYIANIEKSPEAFEVAKTYKLRRTPFIFLAGNVTRDPAVMSSMSVIYKANCYLGDDEERERLKRKIVSELKKCLGDFNPQLVSKRFDKYEIEQSRLIKEKQDEAYKESLNSDKIKKMEREKMMIETERQKKLKDRRTGFLAYLKNSGHFQTQVESCSPKDSVRISLKLPDGRRIIQKFPKSAAMGEIYIFIETQICDIADVSEVTDYNVSEFLDTFSFSFELFKPLPKCFLPCSKISIGEFGDLKTGDSVLFEYKDEYIEEGEES